MHVRARGSGRSAIRGLPADQDDGIEPEDLEGIWLESGESGLGGLLWVRRMRTRRTLMGQANED
eukprot:117362-Chlamydomonas_euryale.AAC.1